ncbi:PREDICTED: uncharacterized protein LOC106820851 [Priapulus caudatus]|uniref:Uncharacterized protein LOC106820851 n=1 Tax=Priapulus caudatus TaxID=37621 RepID=A0ABM1F908_PRICU|nr:PREDICTED: uncharacterized protein LOC106820851 [Priapulus caudatus]
MDIYLQLAALFTLFSTVLALECYVCEEQGDNFDKCVKTIQTCDPEEDKCITYVKWSFVGDWTIAVERQYYITKGCSTTTRCNDEHKRIVTKCQRNWYEDWWCMECCSGDQCNYFVTLGASTARTSVLTVSGCLTLAALWLSGHSRL